MFKVNDKDTRTTPKHVFVSHSFLKEATKQYRLKKGSPKVR